MLAFFQKKIDEGPCWEKIDEGPCWKKVFGLYRPSFEARFLQLPNLHCNFCCALVKKIHSFIHSIALKKEIQTKQTKKHIQVVNEKVLD